MNDYGRDCVPGNGSESTLYCKVRRAEYLENKKALAMAPSREQQLSMARELESYQLSKDQNQET
jgi:hypothetical protein